MNMQDRPVCFECSEPIVTNVEMIFEAPCGHDTCPSAVLHPLCLMTWREKRQELELRLDQIRRAWIEEHESGDR